ncbi:ACP synthase [Marinitoga sp. 1135]|uniref:Holo-[acyl-carrier-protein] synthase n=1 Tax=Marinitoga piezophila (strain DSM 14283 / JCM 11233 / KA3) TaxID=443254 RepID=H2J3P1_MARPK|nr:MULTISPECIES: holo-ACP synthase [Marinitoga]AEX84685.1 holo-(acyl-carrier-protein) synthase [Marinitoga piezophila KA3]APT75212.1 ACP synthase [Marinitoga sp. 1137]NUU94994.1 ACP synthase [Marinitoga sp. 1135]NUU96950.1 ACP synthase [Marinitoga sp. 1138]
MIKGIGVDIVEIDRISQGLEKKVLHDKELEILEKFNGERRKKEFVAGRFSLKESLIKAFGEYIPLKKIAILNNEIGKPYIIEESKEYLFKKFGKKNIHISISHEKHYVVTMVVIEEVE